MKGDISELVIVAHIGGSRRHPCQYISSASPNYLILTHYSEKLLRRALMSPPPGLALHPMANPGSVQCTG